MRNFVHIGSELDVKPLLSAIQLDQELWSEHTERQSYPGSAHKDTECIVLRWCRGLSVLSAFTEIPACDFPAMGLLPEARELINYTLHKVGARELGRVLIVKLHPGGKILPHADEGAYADHYERFHIALDAGPACIFVCGEESVEMRSGELWCFNHKINHSVHNLSGRDRIHLIIDCVAPAFRKEREVPIAV